MFWRRRRRRRRRRPFRTSFRMKLLLRRRLSLCPLYLVQKEEWESAFSTNERERERECVWASLNGREGKCESGFEWEWEITWMKGKKDRKNGCVQRESVLVSECVIKMDSVAVGMSKRKREREMDEGGRKRERKGWGRNKKRKREREKMREAPNVRMLQHLCCEKKNRIGVWIKNCIGGGIAKKNLKVKLCFFAGVARTINKERLLLVL